MRAYSESFFNRVGVAATVGVPVGVGTTLYTTGVFSITGLAASLPALPILVGTLLGVLPAQIAGRHLSNKYHYIFKYSPNINALCQFTIRATTALLGALLGLIVTSLLMNIMINPFTVPALVAGGISAGIILGLYAYAYYALNNIHAYEAWSDDDNYGRNDDNDYEGSDDDKLQNKTVEISFEAENHEILLTVLKGLDKFISFTTDLTSTATIIDVLEENQKAIIAELENNPGIIRINDELTEYGREQWRTAAQL